MGTRGWIAVIVVGLAAASTWVMVAVNDYSWKTWGPSLACNLFTTGLAVFFINWVIAREADNETRNREIAVLSYHLPRLRVVMTGVIGQVTTNPSEVLLPQATEDFVRSEIAWFEGQMQFVVPVLSAETRVRVANLMLLLKLMPGPGAMTTLVQARNVDLVLAQLGKHIHGKNYREPDWLTVRQEMVEPAAEPEPAPPVADKEKEADA